MLRELLQKLSNQESKGSDYLPLNEESLNIHVPSGPGLYLLAIRFGQDGYCTFQINQTNNLYRKLRELVEQRTARFGNFSPEGHRGIQYYVKFFPMARDGRKCEIERMFFCADSTSSPIGTIHCN
jgi:hypothetical protein